MFFKPSTATEIKLLRSFIGEKLMRLMAIGTAVSGAVSDDEGFGPPQKENGRYLTIREIRKRVAAEHVG